MKLASLLTQYLFANNRLELPGIGIFLLDPNAVLAAETSKQRGPLTEGISFEANPQLKDSPDLVQYIAANSGKMKALAEADLHSHVELAQQFLNIGKPFYFEGIGTVTRVKQGEYTFTQGAVVPTRLKEVVAEPTETVKKESKPEYESFLTAPKQKVGVSKPFAVLAIIAGIGIAIFAGYKIATKKSVSEPEPLTMSTNETTVVPEVPKEVVTPVEQATPVSTPVANYKYVLEVAKADRAMKRYKQLRTNQWNVELETRDSVEYKLFLMLPRQFSDTTRVMDSLTVMTGRRVYIEHPL